VKLFGFDLETTGTDVANDKPVQACLVVREAGYNRVIMNTLVNPVRPISPGASAVHGITDDKVKGAPDYVTIAWQLKTIDDLYFNPIVVTYNGDNFDLPMIDNCLGSKVFSGPKLDVLRFVQHYFPEMKGERGGKTLGEIYKLLFGEQLEGAHDASADVTATIKILEQLRVKATIEYGALIEDLSKPRPYKIMPFGKYCGMTLSEVPRSWASFMANKLRNEGRSLDGDLGLTIQAVLSR